MKPVRLGGSSKGCQDKYYSDGFWYKQDSVGYESIAEVLSSRVVRSTNANLIMTDYEPVMIRTKRKSELGCRSNSFLAECEIEYTLARALEGMLQTRYHSQNFPQGITLLEQTISFFKGFENSQQLIDQLSCLLQLDRLLLNVDRHLNNIVLLTHSDGLTELVSFDYGDSLAADITFDFDASLSYQECIAKACARPFSSSFDTQCKMIEKYSNFVLFATHDSLCISDVQHLVPVSVFNRMLNIIEYSFKHYLNCEIKFI